MAKFKIKEGYGDEVEVNASDYRLSGDFFWFEDDKGDNVFTYSASKVLSIARKD